MDSDVAFTRKVAQWLRPFAGDLRIGLSDNAGASLFSFRNARDAEVAWVDSTGDASFADITVNSITIAGGSLDAHTVDLLHAKPSTPHTGEVLTDAHVIATDSTGAANLEATSATIASVLTLSGRTAKQYTTSAHDRLLMRRLVSGSTLADVAALAWGRNSNRRFLNIWVVDTADTLQERALFGEDGGILLGNMAVTRVGTPGDAVHIGGTGQPITATRQQLNILEYTTSPGVGTGGGICFKGSFSAGSPGTLVEYGAVVGKRETAGSGVYGYIGFGTRGTEITNQVTERARITYQGHLLINTTTDDVYHLDVNGAIRGTSITLGDQTANYVFAGPASGAAAAPAFRQLVSDDIPSLDHGAKLTGLTDDDHTQYLLLAGRGGQTISDDIGIGVAADSSFGLYLVKAVTGAATQAYAGSYVIMSATPSAASAGTYSGAVYDARINGDKNITTASGGARCFSTVLRHASSGTITLAQVLRASFSTTGGGTVTELRGFEVATPTMTSGAIGTNSGSYINNQGAAGITTSYGIFIASQSGATTSYSIYTGTGLSSFGGPLAMRNVAAPSAAANMGILYGADQAGEAGNSGLHVITETGDITSIGNRISTTGGLVINSGGGSASTYDTTIKSDNYDALFVDASNDSIAVMNHASGKIGFFAATPIARPTTGSAAASFTANSGTAVNDASTFDGYTLKQVVKALRDFGLLA